ncbi:glycosyltransferase family 4 protein (plasmid) [Proteus mirabilis]|uniref:glycosyltransferase family 4 protein n=1 Tax=Proteus mirabilis TaxID=584 RepID=UPI0038F7C2D3
MYCKKKRAVIVITANTSWYIYNFRKNTIIKLLELGFNVIAVAPQDIYSPKLEKLGASFMHIDIDQGGTNPIKDLKTLFSFYKIYSHLDVDVVLNFTPKNNIYSTLAASVNGTKVINNIAGLGVVFIKNGLTSKIAKFLYKISQSRADKIFFQNEDDRKLFLDAKLASSYVTDRLPGSGVDMNRFNVIEAPDDGKVRFLLIARMLYDKGVGYYVEAARQLKSKYGDQVEFQLLGFLGVNNPSSVTHDEMRCWEDEGIISYLGTSDNVEIQIGAIDCQVLPSFYREGVPKTLLEAGAMGKPIITTDNVGCRETVDDGINGFLCQPKSTQSLVDKLELMINMSHSERLAMGLKSRSKIESEFDESIVIQKYIVAVSELLERC